jgi:SAM-dependent methyltransferase
MSYFSDPSEAERYDASRPYFHPLAIERARRVLGIESRLPLALDVACGTGQSATALLAIAERVAACDISWHMLRNGRSPARIGYVQAPAEALPWRSESASLISCALAFHWFERASFLREAWRVLVTGGALMIYNNGFTGVMRGVPAFQNFSQQRYPERFPAPPRDSRPFTAEEASESGFAWLKEERYENEVVFRPEEVAAYLATQTNVAAVVKDGRESNESVTRWLLGEVQPFFAGEYGVFVFATRAWYLRKEVSA